MLKIKELRKAKGISQVEFARHFNITQNAVSRYENGNSEPSMDLLQQIADYFCVSIEYLLGANESSAKVQQYKDEAFELLEGLTPEQIQHVRSFVAGLKAQNK